MPPRCLQCAQGGQRPGPTFQTPPPPKSHTQVGRCHPTSLIPSVLKQTPLKAGQGGRLRGFTRNTKAPGAEPRLRQGKELAWLPDAPGGDCEPTRHTSDGWTLILLPHREVRPEPTGTESLRSFPTLGSPPRSSTSKNVSIRWSGDSTPLAQETVLTSRSVLTGLSSLHPQATSHAPALPPQAFHPGPRQPSPQKLVPVSLTPSCPSPPSS